MSLTKNEKRESMRERLSEIPGVGSVGVIGVGKMGDHVELRMDEWPVEEFDPVDQTGLNAAIWIDRITTRSFAWEAVVELEIHRYPDGPDEW